MSTNGSLLSSLGTAVQGLIIYLIIVLFVILFQDSYKKVNIISAKQLNSSTDLVEQNVNFSDFTNSFIPLKLNQATL